MARTTPDSVKSILMLDYDSKRNPSLTPFITAANNLTNVVQTWAAKANLGLDSTTLTTIETWLAAHFYCMSDQPYELRSTNGAMGKFQGKTDMGLKATKYGQSAINMDWSNTLNAINEGKLGNTGMTWIGKPPSSQIPYEDRS